MIELDEQMQRQLDQYKDDELAFEAKQQNTPRQYVDAMDEAVETLEMIKRITENPPTWCEDYTLIDATKRAISYAVKENRHVAAAILRFELSRLEQK